MVLALLPQKETITASSLTRESVSFQNVMQTEVPEIATGKTLICRC